MIEVGDQVIGISETTKGTIGTVIEKGFVADRDTLTLRIEIGNFFFQDEEVWADLWERYMP